MQTTPFYRPGIGTSILLSLTVLPHAAYAQSPPGFALEEVIVTAEKRETSLQDTPISIAAFSENDLVRLRITNLHDIANEVPNLDIRQTTNSSAGARVTIRGIGSNDHVVTLDGAVGMYMDGVYIARNTGLALEMTDLERIEVLRGPQGTLWGRNTTGGAISLISKKPSGEFEVKQSVDVGNYDYVRSNTQVDLPLTESLSGKLSLLYKNKSGWVENENGPGHDFGDGEDKGLRAALRWIPRSDITVDYAYDYAESDFTSAYYQNSTPFNAVFSSVPFYESRQDKTTSTARYESSDFRIYGHSLTAEWDVNDQVTLKSISAYRNMTQNNYTDNGANPVSPRIFSNDPFDVDQDQYSQEIQFLGSALDDTLQYTLGLYYFTEKASEYNADFIALGVGGGTFLEVQVSDRELEAQNSAAAAFGEATWTPEVLDRKLHLTAGLRYSADEREIDLRQTILSAQAKENWDNVSPTVVVAYDIAEASNVYFKYVEGYRTGGFNGRALRTETAATPVDEETLSSYELGLKSEWLDQRLRVNTAVFQSDYNDIQLSLIDVDGPPGSILRINAGKAKISGLEIDVTAALTEGLQLRVGYAYLDYEFNDVIDPDTGEDITDDFLPVGAPKNSFNADLQYNFEPMSWGDLSADLNYAWRDKREIGTTASDAGPPLDSYGVWNARLSLGGIQVSDSGQLGVALWVQNFTDEEIQMDGFKLPTTDSTLVQYAEPRTFGLHFMYTYR